MTYRPSAARSLPDGGPEGLSYVQTGKLREHSTAEAISIHSALRNAPSPASYTQPAQRPEPRARVRLLRAAARAYTTLATTSVGPPVNHADPPQHVATFLGVAPPPPLLELRSWQYALFDIYAPASPRWAACDSIGDTPLSLIPRS
jgi:hypothetical protein